MRAPTVALAVAIAALLHIQSPAGVIFTNVTKAQASAGKQTAKAAGATMTLTEATLITKIKAPQTARDIDAEVRVTRDGATVYSEKSLTRTGNQILVNPYLVFPPGVYTIEISPSSAWQRNPGTGQGFVTVEGEKASATKSAAAIAATLGTPDLAGKPFSLTDALAKAKIDPSKLKQDMRDQTQGLNTSVQSGRSKFGNELKQGKQTTDEGEKGPSSGRAKAFEGLSGEGMAPSKYADTYGGQRWNSGRTGSPGNFTGGGKGNTSSSYEDDINSAIAGMLTDAGGTVTGDPQTDAAEAAYMMSVGSDGWEATKNMSADERKSYWTTEQNRQLLGSDVGRPREDDNPSGGKFVVFGNQEMRTAMVKFQAKAVEARRGRAGAAEATSTGGGVKMPMGKDDKPMADRSQGTINWDAVFEINQLVNPTRE